MGNVDNSIKYTNILINNKNFNRQMLTVKIVDLIEHNI